MFLMSFHNSSSFPSRSGDCTPLCRRIPKLGGESGGSWKGLRARNRIRLAFVLWMAGLCLIRIQPAAGADLPPPTEDDLRAAYLYRFGDFVAWPTNKLGAPEAPFVIGVLGNNPIAQKLEDLIRTTTNTFQGRKLQLRRLSSGSDFTECHILFIGRDAEFAPVLASLKAAGHKAAGVLTMSEHERFAERGGMIHLVLIKGRKGNQNIRYSINREATEAAGLKPDPQVYRLALKVIAREPQKENR